MERGRRNSLIFIQLFLSSPSSQFHQTIKDCAATTAATFASLRSIQLSASKPERWNFSSTNPIHPALTAHRYDKKMTNYSSTVNSHYVEAVTLKSVIRDLSRAESRGKGHRQESTYRVMSRVSSRARLQSLCRRDAHRSVPVPVRRPGARIIGNRTIAFRRRPASRTLSAMYRPHPEPLPVRTRHGFRAVKHKPRGFWVSPTDGGCGLRFG